MAKRDDGGNSNGEVRQCFERPGYSIDLICNGWAVIRIESLRGETARQGIVLSCAALKWCRLATSSSEMQRKSNALRGREKDMRCEEMRGKAKKRQVDIRM